MPVFMFKLAPSILIGDIKQEYEDAYKKIEESGYFNRLQEN